MRQSELSRTKNLKSLAPHFQGFRGFTLPELLVSMAIITVIIGVIVYNHRRFDNDIEITNVAYRVAVNIRQAQVYGVSVKQSDIGLSPNFGVPYGVDFHITNNPESKKSYVFFGDANLIPEPGSTADIYDGPYVSGCEEECIERTFLGRGNFVKKFCVTEDDEDIICFAGDATPGGTYNNVDSLSIVFKRPKLDARINLAKNDNGTKVNLPGNTVLVGAAICLKSPLGREKKVAVYTTGQISVEEVEAGDECEPDGGTGSGPGGVGNPGGSPGGNPGGGTGNVGDGGDGGDDEGDDD